MPGGIYLMQGDGELLRMEEVRCDSEAALQRLLARHPDLLAGDSVDESGPRQWVLVRREVALPPRDGSSDRWAVNHLFLDQDGVPTLTEVTRSNSADIRFRMVGQLLDYAANAIAYWPLEMIISSFEKTHADIGLDPGEVLRGLLGEEVDIAAYWDGVESNLQSGKIRLVFVADHIPSELRRVVEFLNRQMAPAGALALEVKQYVGQGGDQPRLTEETFFQELSGGHGNAGVIFGEPV